MKKFLLLLSLVSLLNAKYDNCEFKNPHYSDICKKVVKHGVSYEYANKFLLSYFRTQKFDEISWKYLKPKYIKYHKQREKKANNVLLGRVDTLVDHLKKYDDVYTYAEKKYGVNREIIAAILLKETNLGKIKPTHDAFIVFNTLVTRLQPKTNREKWLLRMGKSNMSAIIEYCYKGGIDPEECKLPSSYAGAVGIPQFMPNSFIYAEAYNAKVADLTKMEDAIVSVAKFLHNKANFTQKIDWSKISNIAEVENEWYTFEYEHERASFTKLRDKSNNKYNCFTKNRPDLEYIKEYVKKILRYNNSANYALGVLRLAYEAHKEMKKNY